MWAFLLLSQYLVRQCFRGLHWNIFKNIKVTGLLSSLLSLLFYLLKLAYQSLNPLLPLEQWELAVPVEICQCNTGGWQTCSANACMSEANIPSTQTHYGGLGNTVKLNSFWVCFNPDCFNTAHGIFCSLLGLSQTSWRGSFNHIALISFTLTF